MDNFLLRILRSTPAVTALVVGPLLAISISTALAQAPKQKEAESGEKPLWQRLLQGDDAKHASELERAIAGDLVADRWSEAITRAEELREFRSRIQGPKHYDVVNAEWWVKILHRVAPMPHENRVAYLLSDVTNRHATILSSQRKYAAAHELFEPALELRRILLGDDHPDTAGIYANLAINLREMPIEDVRTIAERCKHLAIDVGAFGRFAPLQPLFEKVLRIRRNSFGEDHPQTAESYNDAAKNLELQGKHLEAHSGYETVLRIRRRLSPKNYDTAVSLNNLAANFNAQGKYAEAQPYFEEALEIFNVVLPENYLQIATAYNNLAANLDAQGKYAAAEPHHRKALEIRRRSSDDDRDAAHSYNNVATNLEYQGKYAQAQPLHEKALEILRRLLGDDQPFTASSYHGLAINLDEQGRYEAAEPLFEKALEIRRRDCGDDHPATAISYNNLADNLNAQGKYAEAQPLFEKALEISRRLLTDDHPDTALSYDNLATLLNAQGKYAEAQPLYEKALEIRRRLPDRRPPRHRHQLQQPGGQPRRPGEVCPGPAAVREGAGDLPPTAHRRPSRHGLSYSNAGGQPRRPGEVPSRRETDG